MNYINRKPSRQESIFNDDNVDDIVISKDDVRKGILYFQSGMSSFVQTGAPVIEQVEKNYGTKQKPRIHKFMVCKFHGKFKDEDNGIPIYCPFCNKPLVNNGYASCSLAHIPFGGDYSKLEVERRRVRCLNRDCPCIDQNGGSYNYAYPIDFKSQNHMITVTLYNFVVGLLRYGFTLKEVSHSAGLHQSVVKSIHKELLEEKYTVDKEDDSGKEFIKPEEHAKYLAVDEFKLHNGYKFATIIINLENGHILHLTEGKKKSCVYEFIDKVGAEWMSHVKAIACDMNSDYEEAFMDRCPDIRIVYDRFHIIKNFNDKVISQVRIDEEKRLKEEGRIEEAKALKGSKYILMAKESTLNEKGDAIKERYDKLIRENRLFFTIDLVKTAIDNAYKCDSEEEMRKQITNIIEICKGTNNKHFEWFAKLLDKHIDGIVSHAKYHISTGKLEGTNNMIKTIRRKGYGYPDDYYFFLRLFDASRKKDSY